MTTRRDLKGELDAKGETWVDTTEPIGPRWAAFNSIEGKMWATRHTAFIAGAKAAIGLFLERARDCAWNIEMPARGGKFDKELVVELESLKEIAKELELPQN